MCLKTALQAYQSNGWKIKPELEQLTHQPWYNASVNERDLKAFLQSLCGDAIEYLHGPTEKVIGVIENIHKSEKGFQVFINKSTTLSVRMGVHKSNRKPQAGDYVELSLSANGKEREVVASVPCQSVEIADVGTVEGELRVAQKGFGFVDDTFVPPFLIGDVTNASRVRVLRIMAWDKTKARHNWKAIKLTQLGA